MSQIWSSLVFLSVFFALLFGRLQPLISSVNDGAKSAVDFIISIAGILCFWSGIMEIMRESGLSEKVSCVIRPLLSPLFGKRVMNDTIASEAVSSNITSNLLGLANASTPLGLRAADRIHELYGRPDHPPSALITLIVLNTASLQLFPTTVAAVRASLGSSDPYGILLPVWAASAVSVSVGIFTLKLFEKFCKKDGIK